MVPAVVAPLVQLLLVPRFPGLRLTLTFPAVRPTRVVCRSVVVAPLVQLPLAACHPVEALPGRLRMAGVL